MTQHLSAYSRIVTICFNINLWRSRQIRWICVQRERTFGGRCGHCFVTTGSPVSPGFVEGVIHIVFDPHNAQLAPGEILVCPGTDPSWTPLFLSAGGLVMEVGGLMTHGGVVAREYGIPAVVGISDVTRRLKTGQRIRVDGTTGQVVIIENFEER